MVNSKVVHTKLLSQVSSMDFDVSFSSNLMYNLHSSLSVSVFVPGFDDACAAVDTCCDGGTIDNDTFNTCIEGEEVDIDFTELFPEGGLDLPDCEGSDAEETTVEDLAEEEEVLAGIIEEEDVGSMPLMRKVRKRVLVA